jgi:hypothetical protein
LGQAANQLVSGKSCSLVIFVTVDGSRGNERCQYGITKDTVYMLTLLLLGEISKFLHSIMAGHNTGLVVNGESGPTTQSLELAPSFIHVPQETR